MTSNSDKFYSARIVERRDIAPDLWTIRVDPGGEFNYRSGQYATLGVVTPEKHYERPYSIVSSPHEKYLEFFFELVPQGQLMPRLHSAQVGDQITLRKSAKGSFTLDLSPGRVNHFLIATVTGIAPFVSYVRSLRHKWSSSPWEDGRRLFILQGASRSSEFGYSQELQKAAKEVPWLTYVPTVSRPKEDQHWKGETGRVDDVVRKYSDLWKLQPSDSKVYLCGHPGMIENVHGIFQRCNWPDEVVRSEAYFVPAEQNSKSARG